MVSQYTTSLVGEQFKLFHRLASQRLPEVSKSTQGIEAHKGKLHQETSPLQISTTMSDSDIRASKPSSLRAAAQHISDAVDGYESDLYTINSEVYYGALFH